MQSSLRTFFRHKRSFLNGLVHRCFKLSFSSVANVQSKFFPAGKEDWEAQAPWSSQLPLEIKDPITDQAIQLAHVTCHGSKDLSYETIGEMFDNQVEKYGDQEVIVVHHQNIRWSWKQLKEKVDAFSIGLIGMGYKKGDRLGIWLPNTIEWVIAQFATAKTGVVLVNINPAYRTSELENALNQVGVKGLIMMPQFLKSNYLEMIQSLILDLEDAKGPDSWTKSNQSIPSLEHIFCIAENADQVPPGLIWFDTLLKKTTLEGMNQLSERLATLSPHDAINIQFTSGTTGLPKGATLTHHNILNNGEYVGKRMNLTTKDKLCVPVPLYHCFGLVLGNLAALTHGSSIVYPSAQFDAEKCLRAVVDEKCTALHGVPTMFIAMMNHPEFSNFDFSTLRTGILAGASPPVEVMKRVIADMNMDQVTICYGMTETSPVSFMTAPDDSLRCRVETVGRTLDHVECKVVGDDGRTVPVGEAGELYTTGYCVMKGYWDDPVKTEEAITSDGWMRTGDTAIIDQEGYCSIIGRTKDTIIRGGENIYPREIEEFLYTHLAVSDVQIVGVPDDKYGEQVCAWIKLKPGIDTENINQGTIQEYCKDKIAHYKIPQYVLFVEEMPVTITGKAQKYLMRDKSVEMIGLAEKKNKSNKINK